MSAKPGPFWSAFLILSVMMDGDLLLLVSVHVCLAWALVSIGDNLVPSIVSKLVEMCDLIIWPQKN